MNTTSVFHADAAASGAKERTTLIWDLPVRVFHWLMVLGFAGAWLSAESERWRLLHVTLGYTLAGLVIFRLAWGLAGTRHARFENFVRGRQKVMQYLRSLMSSNPEYHAGHNPAGALAILALLGMTLAVGASGWAADQGIAAKWMEETHEVLANLMLLIIGLHIAGVLVSSWLHRENLIGAMITGNKACPPGMRAQSSRRGIALLLITAVLGFWATQWYYAPQGGDLAKGVAAETRSGHHDKDDD